MVHAFDERVGAKGVMMFFVLIKLELLKLRRSLPLFMMFACPLLVVLLSTGMVLKSGSGPRVGFWVGFWHGNLALWSYFMLPLYIALVTALLNGNEHRNQAWRLLFTLPVTRRQIYLAKMALAWGSVVGANLALGLLAAGAAGIIMQFRPDAGAAFGVPIVPALAKVSLACLPVVLIQHALSWRVANFVLPLGVGVCATMGILQFSNTDYWPYFPWSYSLLASSASDTSAQPLALMLAAGVGAALLVITTYLAGRREIAA
jgi:hypothetical protein